MMSPNSRTRKKYLKDFKQEAVKLAEEVGVATAAERLGVSQNVIYSWKRALEKEGPEAFRGQGTRTSLEAELSRLRRECNELRMERDILKKAATYFARHQK